MAAADPLDLDSSSAIKAVSEKGSNSMASANNAGVSYDYFEHPAEIINEITDMTSITNAANIAKSICVASLRTAEVKKGSASNTGLPLGEALAFSS